MEINEEDMQPEADELNKMIELLHEIPEVPIPDRFDLQFRLALQAEISQEKRRKHRRMLQRRGSALAAVFVVGILSVAMLSDGLHIGMSNLAVHPESTDYSQQQQESKTATQYGIQDNEEDTDHPAAAMDEGVSNQSTKQEKSTGAAENSAVRAVPQAEAPKIEKKKTEVQKTEEKKAAGAQLYSKEEKVVDAVGNSMQNQNETTDTAFISRSFGYFKTLDEYNKACNDWIGQYSKALNEKDGQLFVDTVAKGGISGYTTSTALDVMALYGDYLGSEKMAYRCIGCNTAAMEKSYIFSGKEHDIVIKVKLTSAGLLVSEPLLDHGLWLLQQLDGVEHSLVDYNVRKDGDEIQFNVSVLVPQSSDETANGEALMEEVRGIVWTKTGSSL